MSVLLLHTVKSMSSLFSYKQRAKSRNTAASKGKIQTQIWQNTNDGNVVRQMHI